MDPDHTYVRDLTSPLYQNLPSRQSLLPRTSAALRCLPHIQLLQLRSGWHLAGLETQDIDEEVARRVLLQPQMWPGVFGIMERSGALEPDEEVRLEDGESGDAAEWLIERRRMAGLMTRPDRRLVIGSEEWQRRERVVWPR